MNAVPLTQAGKIKEVGFAKLDSTTARMLNIPADSKKDADQQRLVQFIEATHDLSDFTPMNSKYGPHSGMSKAMRLVRAYNLGLLKPISID